MRKSDTQLGTPYTEYKDTKANIEALASPVEGMIAYATDTDQLGTYNGASWDWRLTQTQATDLTDGGNTTLHTHSIYGVTSGTLAQFAATTSAQLAGVLSDETGSGAAVFATSPTLVTPLLGTPTSGVMTNVTGLPEAGLTLSDNTTKDASTTAHGFLPKLAAALVPNFNGIKFPSTQTESADANTLDDYQESDITPTCVPNSGSLTLTSVAGKRTKIGRLVTIFIQVVVATDSGSGYIRIGGMSGLPSYVVVNGFENGVSGLALVGSFYNTTTVTLVTTTNTYPSSSGAIFNLHLSYLEE